MFISKMPNLSFNLGLFNKRAEFKQKTLFINMLVNNKAKKETNQA